MMEVEYRRELLSGLQKSIRRDNTELALECAKELDLNGYDIWSKLVVYSAEDIGRGCPWIASYLYEEKQKYLDESDLWKKRSILLNVVNYLCKQNKSRIADNAVHAYCKKFQPDISLDISKTDELKKMFINSIQEKDVDNALKSAAYLYKLCEEDYMIQVFKMTNDSETKALISQFQDALNRTRDKFDLLFLVNLILHQTMDLTNLPVVKTDQISILTETEIHQIYNKNKILSRLGL